MASELSARYEELNLVYDTEGQVNEFSHGEHRLRELVINCTKYVDVIASAVVLPEKHITIYPSAFNKPIPSYIHTTPKCLKRDLYASLKINNKSIVINDAASCIKPDLDPEFPYKLIVSPVLQSKDDISGFMVILRYKEMQDFQNSDRSLLDVLANKASKIIQLNYDSLTGLMKRHGFENKLKEALILARGKDLKYCVLNLNLDRLKVINDVASHQVGDEVIRRVGKNIVTQLRDTDTVARLGGEVFGVLLDKCPLEQGKRIAQKLRKMIIELGFPGCEQQFQVSASIGMSMMTANTETVESVLGATEIATQVAKERGGNQVKDYDQGDTNFTRRKDEMYWINDVLKALRENRFRLYYQPIESLSVHSEKEHAEILLRLEGEGSEYISPGLFMPAIENYHLMPAIDRWVVENSLKLLSQLIAKAWSNLAGVIWSINLSGQSPGDSDFMNFVVDQFSQTGVSPKSICFEITETSTIGNMEDAHRFVLALKKLGCRFALDDFGVGSSSFSYLKNLPVDYLKIDGSFIKEITKDPISRAIVSAINDIGYLMGIETIGEYVENDSIKKHLKSLGVDYVQGYGIAKPQPLEENLYKIISQPGANVA